MNTPKKSDKKKSKRHLRVHLTSEELLVSGKSNADKTIELLTVENDKKRIMDDFKAKISALQAEVQNLSNKISSGYEYRMVTCTEFLGKPEPDKKTVMRDDTGEEVAIENISSEEMQRELINQEGE